MDRKIIKKEIFGQRLKYLMTNFHETTYSMSNQFNLSAPSISRYTRGEMLPKITTIQTMAQYFDVSPQWLMGYNVSMYNTEILDNVNPKRNQIELSVFKQIKYDTAIFSNEKMNTTLSMPSTQLAQWHSVFALAITDDIMEPTLLKDDIVVIKLNTFLRSGDLTALHINHSDLQIRKLSFLKKQVIVQPHNPAFAAEVYDLNKDEIQIIGSVVYQRRIYERYFSEK